MFSPVLDYFASDRLEPLLLTYYRTYKQQEQKRNNWVRRPMTMLPKNWGLAEHLFPSKYPGTS